MDCSVYFEQGVHNGGTEIRGSLAFDLSIADGQVMGGEVCDGGQEGMSHGACNLGHMQKTEVTWVVREQKIKSENLLGPDSREP